VTGESEIQRIKRLLETHGVRPSKRLGQHFLIDPVALDRVVAAADLTPADTVLEIGPGPGGLTRRLAGRAGHVVAVELDHTMVELLRAELAAYPHVHILQADILKFDIAGEMRAHHPEFAAHFKVVANLPYYITSAVLRHVLEAQVKPELVVVTVQREVAERIVAQPGSMSLLAVSVQFYGWPRVVAHIPAGAFYPPPKVESAVVRIEVYPEPPVLVDNVDHFFKIVRAGFGQKRKQIHNALQRELSLPATTVVEALRAAGVEPKRRAETLSLAEWAAVAQALTSPSNPCVRLRLI